MRLCCVREKCLTQFLSIPPWYLVTKHTPAAAKNKDTHFLYRLSVTVWVSHYCQRWGWVDTIIYYVHVLNPGIIQNICRGEKIYPCFCTSASRSKSLGLKFWCQLPKVFSWFPNYKNVFSIMNQNWKKRMYKKGFWVSDSLRNEVSDLIWNKNTFMMIFNIFHKVVIDISCCRQKLQVQETGSQVIFTWNVKLKIL